MTRPSDSEDPGAVDVGHAFKEPLDETPPDVRHLKFIGLSGTD